MRGDYRVRLGVAMAALATVALVAAGCRTSTKSGLPDHIKTVEVHIFQNKTMYKGTEGIVTRAIIDRINADPRIHLTSRGGDGLITGEIKDIQRTTLRETTTNEPGTVRITIIATYSFYDTKQRRYLIEDATVTSTDTGLSPGLYESSRGGTSAEGERSAAQAIAGEIVRRTIGMW